MTTNPIHNNEVEQQVIGLLIKDCDQTSSREVLDTLSTVDFYSRVHAHIFDTIKKMVEHKKEVSLILLETELEVIGRDYGGFVYLSEIMRAATGHANLGAYTAIVKQCSLTRSLQKSLYAATDMLEHKTPCQDVIETLSQELIDITTNDNGKELRHLKSAEGDWLDELQKRADRGGSISGLETGIEVLDEKINGVDSESLVVVAGSPSMGKTLFCQTIAKNIGVDQRKNIMFFSMEMSEQALFERFVSGIGNILPSKLKNAQLGNEELGRIDGAVRAIRSSGIYITDEAKQSVGQIRSKARRHKNKHGELAAIFIDYLGLMKLGKADRHDIAIGNITRDLKELAKELKAPIFLCVQAKRPSNIKDRPNMASLKDSSCIEADADLILFVHRQEIIEPETDMKGITEIIIAKDRHNDANGTIYAEKINGAFVGIGQEQAGQIQMNQETKKAGKGMAGY